ncbi:hypothetical protein [Bacillus thuringiensis]
MKEKDKVNILDEIPAQELIRRLKSLQVKSEIEKGRHKKIGACLIHKKIISRTVIFIKTKYINISDKGCFFLPISATIDIYFLCYSPEKGE